MPQLCLKVTWVLSQNKIYTDCFGFGGFTDQPFDHCLVCYSRGYIHAQWWAKATSGEKCPTTSNIMRPWHLQLRGSLEKLRWAIGPVLTLRQGQFKWRNLQEKSTPLFNALLIYPWWTAASAWGNYTPFFQSVAMVPKEQWWSMLIVYWSTTINLSLEAHIAGSFLAI